ncbi:MAG: TonB-dependent receptor [Bacteroidales bacterium]|nr:TonB-dependent receptor [Bacteroidales bacterium]
MKKNLFLVVAIFLLSTAAAFSQRTITGQVTSADEGLGMPGVSILVKNTTTGTRTDDDGNFTLNIPANDVALVVSFVGFQTVEIPVGNQSRIDIALQPDVLALDDVVVTATKTIRNLIEVPSRINVVSSKTIEASPALLVEDILRFTPGVNIDRSVGIFSSSNPSVTLRGLSGDEQSRTLVLMNGVPINASDGGSVNWNKINQYDVERIEVFKGPGSSLYGNNAMGGVINIITKVPDKPQEIYGSLTYGTFHTIRQDLALRIRSDKGFYGSLSQNLIKSNGYLSIPEEQRTPYDIKRNYEAIDVSARAGYDKNNWLKTELQYDVYRGRRGEGTRVYIPLGNYRRFDTDLLRGVFKGGGDKTQYDMNVYYQMINYTDLNESVRSNGVYQRYDVDSYRKDWGALFNFSQQLADNNTLTGGLEYKNGSVKGGDYYQTAPFDTVYNKGMTQIYAGYVQDEHAFWDEKIRLVAGLRYDYVAFSDGYYYSTSPWGDPPELKDHHWSEFSPRIGLRFNFIQEFSGYLSYSHGFRASILDDLTRTGYMWVGPKYANPDLGPESIDNYEIGADLILSKFKLSVSGYYAKGDDFLYYVNSGDELSPGRPIYRRENVSSVSLKGAETEISYYPLSNLRFLASYTYSHSTINKFDLRPDLVDKFLTYVPKNRFSLAMLWQNKIVNVNVQALYKSAQFSDDANTDENIIDAFTTLDLQLSRKLFGNFSGMIDIQDLFDNQHMQTLNSLSPGRRISVKVAFKF